MGIIMVCEKCGKKTHAIKINREHEKLCPDCYQK
jgi:hypothetical protein